VSIVVSLLHSLRFLVRSRAVLHIEILALRHQLTVANRSRCPRLRLIAADRVLWAWLSHRWSGWRPSSVRWFVRCPRRTLWGAPQIHGELQKLGTWADSSQGRRGCRHPDHPLGIWPSSVQPARGLL